jgi:hypothetical protein
MEKESSVYRLVEANSTGGQDSCRAVVPSDDEGVQDPQKLRAVLKYIAVFTRNQLFMHDTYH